MLRFAALVTSGTILLVACHPEPIVESTTETLASAVAPNALSAAAISATQIALSWTDDVRGESGWEVHRSTTGANGTYSLRAVLAANTTSHTDSGLTASTAYCYKVRSFKSATKPRYDAFFDVACATTQAVVVPGPAPAAPSNVTATGDPAHNDVDLTWVDNSADETGFRVELSEGGSSSWRSVATVGPNTTSTVHWIFLFEVLLCYRVVAIGTSGEAASGPACTVLLGAPGQVTAVSHDATSIDLTWHESSLLEDGFEIYRWTGSNAAQVIGTVGANVTSYHDATVVSDVLYNYGVRSKRGTDRSLFSYATGLAASKVPAPPVIDAYLISSSASEILWSLPAGAISERFERSTDGGVTWTLFESGVVGYPVSDAVPTEFTICYRAIASNGLGDSPPSNVDCVTAMAAPTNVQAIAIGSDSMEVTWTDNSNFESGYTLELCDFPCDGISYVGLPANTVRVRVPVFSIITLYAFNGGGWSDPAYPYFSGSGCVGGCDASWTSLRTAPPRSRHLSRLYPEAVGRRRHR